MESEGKKNPLKALAFLEVGLFEFGFVAIVLLLFFGTLNYFNILPVSSVFPQQLGWLPKQTQNSFARRDLAASLLLRSLTLSHPNSDSNITLVLDFSLEPDKITL